MLAGTTHSVQGRTVPFMVPGMSEPELIASSTADITTAVSYPSGAGTGKVSGGGGPTGLWTDRPWNGRCPVLGGWGTSAAGSRPLVAGPSSTDVFACGLSADDKEQCGTRRVRIMGAEPNTGGALSGSTRARTRTSRRGSNGRNRLVRRTACPPLDPTGHRGARLTVGGGRTAQHAPATTWYCACAGTKENGRPSLSESTLRVTCPRLWG